MPLAFVNASSYSIPIRDQSRFTSMIINMTTAKDPRIESTRLVLGTAVAVIA